MSTLQQEAGEKSLCCAGEERGHFCRVHIKLRPSEKRLPAWRMVSDHVLRDLHVELNKAAQQFIPGRVVFVFIVCKDRHVLTSP